MITTRNVTAQRPKRREKLVFTTTKTIEHKEPKVPVIPKEKPVSITTGSIGDVQDIADKKKRDDIMKERKAFKAGDMVFCSKTGEFVKQVEPEIITAPAIVKDGEGNLMPTIKVEEKVEARISPRLEHDDDGNVIEMGISGGTELEVEEKEVVVVEKKKPWNKMNAKERKEYQIKNKNKKGEQNAKRKD